MTDYADLVRRLRACCECEQAPLGPLLGEAADAIERLAGKAEPVAWEDAHKSWCSLRDPTYCGECDCDAPAPDAKEENLATMARIGALRCEGGPHSPTGFLLRQLADEFDRLTAAPAPADQSSLSAGEITSVESIMALFDSAINQVACRSGSDKVRALRAAIERVIDEADQHGRDADEQASLRRKAEAELEREKKEHDLATTFHAIAVKERDYERRENAALLALLAWVRDNVVYDGTEAATRIDAVLNFKRN